MKSFISTVALVAVASALTLDHEDLVNGASSGRAARTRTRQRRRPTQQTQAPAPTPAPKAPEPVQRKAPEPAPKMQEQRRRPQRQEAPKQAPKKAPAPAPKPAKEPTPAPEAKNLTFVRPQKLREVPPKVVREPVAEPVETTPAVDTVDTPTKKKMEMRRPTTNFMHLIKPYHAKPKKYDSWGPHNDNKYPDF